MATIILIYAKIRYANIEDYSIRNNVYNRPIHKLFDKSLSWEDVSWLKRYFEFLKIIFFKFKYNFNFEHYYNYIYYFSQTRLPIVIKGILTVEDALLSVKYGASAIQVSNHGARQVDGVPAPVCLSQKIYNKL